MKGKRKTGASSGGASATGHTFVRLTESSNGKHLSLVVDVGNSNRCRKFSDDELGDAARFAISTEGVAAFKEFLFPDDGPKFSSRVTDSSFVCVRHNRWTGLRYGVVMARLSNGQLRAISFYGSRGHSRDRSRGDDELVRKAIAFTRSNSFREWREQGKVDKAGGGGGGVGGGGERVECRCGKNRNRGQMVACDVCGAREHVDCVGYSQIPGDHMCSTCFKAHKEDVIVISMDEQAEGRLLNSGESWTDPKARDRGGGNEAVCSICGCEDNEDFETMIQPCSCDGASLSAHPNCVSLAEECFSKERRLTCHACGRPSSCSTKPLPVKRSTRRLPAETSSKAVKRLRSALVHPGKADDAPTAKVKEAVQEKMDVEEKKPDASLLGRRFSDAPSTVPIKKRRIQIMDSPSRSPSPGTKLDAAEFTHDKQNGLDAKTSHGKEVYDERLPKCTQNKVEEEEDPAVLDYELPKDDEFERSEPSRGDMDSDSAVHSNDDGRTTKQVDSGNRSHWDLNMDMDAWERPCEDDTDEQQVDSAGNDTSPHPGTDGGVVAGNVVEPSEEEAHLEAVQSAASDAKPVVVEDEDLSTKAEVETVTKDADIVNTCSVNTSPKAEDSEQVTDTTSCTLPDEDPVTTDNGDKPEEKIVQNSASKEAEYKDVFTDDTFEEEEEPDSTEKLKTEEDKTIVEPEKVEEGQITTDDWVREAGEEMEAENVDYEDSDDGEEADEKVAHTEPEYEGEQGEIHETDTKQESVPEMSGNAGVENNCEQSRGDDRPDTQRRASSSGRLKSSGWDQLPEGFETAEDALRASKDLLKRNPRIGAWTGGRIRPPGTSRVSQFDNNLDRFRHDDQPWARHEHDQRGDMYDAETRFYNREFGRGRSRGGPSSPLVHPRRDMWANGSAVSQQWPKHHLSPPPGRFADGVGFVPHGQANAAAVAAAKVESSGFVVAPDGTITKAGSPGAVVRGGRPFPAGSRNPPSLMMNPRLPDPEVMVSGRNIGLSPGMRLPGLTVGPGMGMNPGMRGGRPYVDTPPVSSRGGHYICEHPDGFRGRRSPTMREHRRSRSRSRSNSPRRSFGRHSRSPGYGKVSRELSPASSIPKLPLPPPPPRGQRSPPAGLRRLNDNRVERRYFEHDYHSLDREPRTSGWDLGPGDVGRLAVAGHGMGRFDDMDRRVDHDRRNREDMHRRVELGRRDKSATSSRHPGGGVSRDVEDEVAPRRRRPPSS